MAELADINCFTLAEEHANNLDSSGRSIKEFSISQFAIGNFLVARERYLWIKYILSGCFTRVKRWSLTDFFDKKVGKGYIVLV